MIYKLQIPGIEFHITNFLENNLLHLVAVLLVLIPASLLGLVGADQSVLHSTYWLQRLLLALVTDLPGLLLAVLGVAVLFGLLRASLHLQLADLLRFKVAILLLNWDLSWDVVTILSRFPAADHTLGPIAIVLGGLVPLAIELNRVGAGNVVDYLLLHVAIRGLNVGALVVILC